MPRNIATVCLNSSFFVMPPVNDIIIVLLLLQAKNTFSRSEAFQLYNESIKFSIVYLLDGCRSYISTEILSTSQKRFFVSSDFYFIFIFFFLVVACFVDCGFQIVINKHAKMNPIVLNGFKVCM